MSMHKDVLDRARDRARGVVRANKNMAVFVRNICNSWLSGGIRRPSFMIPYPSELTLGQRPAVWIKRNASFPTFLTRNIWAKIQRVLVIGIERLDETLRN